MLTDKHTNLDCTDNLRNFAGEFQQHVIVNQSGTVLTKSRLLDMAPTEECRYSLVTTVRVTVHEYRDAKLA